MRIMNINQFIVHIDTLFHKSKNTWKYCVKKYMEILELALYAESAYYGKRCRRMK